MNTTLEQNVREIAEERKSLRTAMGGSLAEGILSGIAVVLSLIGLSSITMSEAVLSVTAITLGAAFLLQGISVSTRFSKLLAQTSKDRLDEAEIGAGMSAEFLAGSAGIILGILGLLKISPTILIPVAAIIFGVTLMLSSGLTLRLDTIELELYAETTKFKKVAHEAMVAAAGLEILLGLGAVVLGIVALASFFYYVSLSLVAMLIVGLSGLVSGAALTARMASLFKREQPVKA